MNNSQRKFHLTIVVILLLLIISISFVREPLLYDYNIQILGEPSIPPYTEQIIASHSLDKLLSMWDENNLGVRKLYPTGLFTRVLILGLAHLGLDGGLIYNILILLALFIGSLGFYFLSIEIMSSRKSLSTLFSALVGALYYVSSPFFYYHTLFGHQNTLISYALAPWGILYYLKSLKDGKLMYILISGILLGLGTQMINFLPMNIIVLIVLTVLHKSGMRIKILSFFLVTLVILLENFFWILPNAITPQYGLSFIYAARRSIAELIKLSPSPLEAFLGLSLPFDIYELGLGYMFKPWILSTIILVLLAFTLLIVSKRETIEKSMPFVLLSVLSLAWLFGFKSCLLTILKYVYLNISLMTFFRNISHIHFIYSLSISILLSLSIRRRYERLPSNKQRLFISLLIVLLAIHIYPFATGHFGEIDIKFNYPRDQENLVKFFIEEGGDYRVLLLPMDSIVRYKSKEYYGLWGRDPILQYFPKPTFDLQPHIRHKPEYNFVIMLLNLIRSRDTAVHTYLSRIGVKYVVLRNNPRGIIGYDYNETREFFDRDKHFLKIFEGKEYVIYKNLNFNNEWRFQTCIPVITSSISFDLLNFGQYFCLIDLTQTYMNVNHNYSFYLLDPEGLESLIPQIPFYSITRVRTITWAESVNPYRGWVPYFKSWWLWRELTNYPYQPIFTFKSGAKLTMSLNIKESGYYKVFIHFFVSQKGGKIALYIGNSTFIVKTKTSFNKYIWKELGMAYLKGRY